MKNTKKLQDFVEKKQVPLAEAQPNFTIITDVELGIFFKYFDGFKIINTPDNLPDARGYVFNSLAAHFLETVEFDIPKLFNDVIQQLGNSKPDFFVDIFKEYLQDPDLFKSAFQPLAHAIADFIEKNNVDLPSEDLDTIFNTKFDDRVHIISLAAKENEYQIFGFMTIKDKLLNDNLYFHNTKQMNVFIAHYQWSGETIHLFTGYDGYVDSLLTYTPIV
jgi:hypothetical protein